MNAPDSDISEKMNWVDYCDSLRDKHFFLPAQSQKPFRVAEHLPDPVAVASAWKEMAREVT